MPSLPGTSIEIVAPRPSAAVKPRAALFDWDGTISLVRSGWDTIMLQMMVEVLTSLSTGETPRELEIAISEPVFRLTGKPTIHQMMELAEQVRRRGGTPREADEYLAVFRERLGERLHARLAGVRDGSVPPDALCVPGARRLLGELRHRGLRLYLLSGTDEAAVFDEARLLGVQEYFNGSMHGAPAGRESFSKQLIIGNITDALSLKPGELLGFGDGFTETRDVKEAGGVAIAVATDEPECAVVNQRKRARLLEAGAEIVIPNYLESGRLLDYLFGEHESHPLSDVRSHAAEAEAAE